MLFEQLGIFGNIAILAGALIILSRASNITVSNSIKVAETTGLSKTSVGFILVAFSTSLPELLIAIFAVLSPGSVGVSIGNVLGSNIVNICLVLGTCFIVLASVYRKNLKKVSELAEEEWGSLNFGLLVASLVPLVLLYIGFASRVIGIVLLAIFAYYMYRLAKVRTPLEQDASPVASKTAARKYTTLAILGALGVVLCSYLIVESSSFLATSVGIPNVVIGATIVAFGTSIPELSTSLESIRKGQVNLALGNIIGSCFINITAILGVTLLASPTTIDVNAFSRVVLFSSIANLLLWYFLASRKIGRLEGWVLVFLYVLFLVVSLVMA
ncbi:MAG: sodium:calcium antiporter [Candidatus Bathyarchaeia archaeon]